MSTRQSTFIAQANSGLVSIDVPPSDEQRETLYTVRFARGEKEIDAALRLRFEIFNLELNEGLDASFISGRDEDRFDKSCHHLIVIENSTDRVVGTYRVRTLEMAVSAFGFYSSSEFTVENLPYEVLAESLETGRACIAREHRNSRVLFLLWKGLSKYMLQRRKRYAFGCCSLPTQDRIEGARAMNKLVREGHLHEKLRVAPRDGLGCHSADPDAKGETALPKLFQTYLRIGAKICGEPVIDTHFKTIDFFIIIDIRTMPRKYFEMLFGQTVF